MKIFTERILAHRKVIFIFFFAIFIPSLIVGYLSLSTFSKRREAIRKLLESNLWISGEAALKSFETALFEHEKKALKSENFVPLFPPQKTYQPFFNSSSLSKEIAGQLFLLDADYQIIFPKTGREASTLFQWQKDILNSPFVQSFQRAEFFEFSQKNYTRAADLYKECTLSSPSKQHRAIALEGLGRCLLSSKKYEQASKVYNELSNNYAQFQSKAGHPYGIIAKFQLYEINQRRKKAAKGLENLLNLYKKIRAGEWLLNTSTYDFFVAEIDSVLSQKLNERNISEIRKSYQNLKKQPSLYQKALDLTNLLEKKAIPMIREKVSHSPMEDESVPGRLLITQEQDFALISFTVLPNFQSKKSFYGGFRWDLNYLKNQMIPQVFENVARDSGILLGIVDEKGEDILSGEKALNSEITLEMSYRPVPLPWKLVVSHAEIKDLERAARQEIFSYGILLAVVVALMFFGAILIVRDISRESETARLKTQFVHNISHELKTPLTLIRLYGETLQRKKNLTNEERKESYQIITKESERLSHLIDNVLDFSRIETGRKEFSFRKGNLAKVVRDTLESFHYHLEKKGFTLQTEIATDLPELNFDGEAIASVLVNLLSNAMKFSPKQKKVTVKLFRDDENAVFQVADKGIGIAPQEKSKIFQRFNRSKNKTVSETRGSGLGLTLVKHIVEAHGGQIKVESEPGKGSTFSVILPFSGL